MIKSILCAIDGSAHADKAIEVACALAGKFDAKLTFLTVTKPIKVTEEVKRYMELEHLTGELQYVLNDFTEEAQRRARDAARGAGVGTVKAEVRSGPPARTIVQFAQSSGADVIVLGKRGHGDLEGLLLGSVSNKVGHLAKCTVITVT